MARRRKSPRKKSEARSQLAASRPRGPGGRFLTKAEIEAMEAGEGVETLVVVEPEVVERAPQVPAASDEVPQSVVDAELARLRHAPVDTFGSGGGGGDHSMLERSMKRHERRLRRG